MPLYFKKELTDGTATHASRCHPPVMINRMSIKKAWCGSIRLQKARTTL